MLKRKPRLLFVQVELHTWARAKSWPYSCHLGLEEGFKANLIDFFTVTTPWIPRIRELCAGKQFDQVWVNGLMHTNDHDGGVIDDDTWEWLAKQAPIRVGLLIESVQYDAKETAAMPWLLERKAIAQRRVGSLTHMVAVDEKDVERFEQSYQTPAIWSPFAIPERYIHQSISPPTWPTAAFGGTLYGERAAWLEEAKAKNLLDYQKSPDKWAFHRLLFFLLPKHRLNDLVSRRLFKSAIPDTYLNPAVFYPAYLDMLRWIRRRGFSQWLKSMQKSPIVVGLPHLIKSYPTRVFEGMAVGRPVLAWQVAARPRNNSLFEDTKEIMLYSTPSQLADQIEQLLGDPALRRSIAENARAKLTSFHTVEKRVAQILNWIENGTLPTYS